ncbi:MAG TPA: SDR family oxidoreductase [Candidatus Dormibacteraeota bacterium]|jgi:NAD(P)-dependent dehydrogenase (short-subunit alcohol dehydrogenase family)
MTDVPTVLITGASSGIGAACARRLDAAGWRVFAGVRRQADAGDLVAGCSSRLTPLLLDVTDADSIRAAAATVSAAVGAAGLHGLVNNAGVSGGDPVEFADLDAVRAMLEVNLVGPMAVTQALLPRVRNAQGRIVCIGSIGGRYAVPFLSTYSASKAGLAAFCDSLRVEVAPWGIRVVLIEPGAVATTIWSKGRATLDRRRSTLPAAATALYGGAVDAMRRVTERVERSAMPPDRVARVVERALAVQHPRTRYLVGADAHVQATLRRLPAPVRDAVLTRVLGLPRTPAGGERLTGA